MALTKREELKMLVKVKLDELSPFDNLHGDETIKGFIAADGDADYDQVNPISSYIEKTLDDSSEFCLRNLPTQLLISDVECDTEHVNIDIDGVGHILGIDRNNRLVRLSVKKNLWDRDVTSFITPMDENYVKQQKRWTRGGQSKPIVAFVPEKEELELYSFDNHTFHAHADVYYIECNKEAEKVKSPISDYIALRCAAYVLEILGDEKKAAVLMTEYDNKITAL